MQILIYSEFNSLRLQYICYQIFTIWLEWDCTITSQKEVYRRFEGGRINYSGNKIAKDREVFIPASFLLQEKKIKRFEQCPTLYNKIPALFKKETPNATLPFDLFATIFFYLSRYEEYLPFLPDQHDRFPASASWAYQQQHLHLPIVDLLVKELQQQCIRQFPCLSPPKHKFKTAITYDIDMAWAYKNKGFNRSIGGFFTDLLKGEWGHLKNRINTLIEQQQDPFDVFERLKTWHQIYQVTPIFFFLLGNHSTFDKNTSPSNIYFQRLIQQIVRHNSIGIHPSYQSNDLDNQLEKEIQQLATISKQPIRKSRQHFLKLKLPATYRHLIENGIQEEYTMGFAEAIGFRAGTSRPFYWYDLEREEQTTLRLHPFQIMDVTLKEYLQLTPEEAKKSISQIVETIRSVEGVFCSIWHNSSFSSIGNWEGWDEVYEHLLKSCKF